jgi:hypothetical protein
MKEVSMKIRHSSVLDTECQAFYERLVAKGTDDLDELHELSKTSCPETKGDGYEDFESGYEFASQVYEARMRYGDDFGEDETSHGRPVEILRGDVFHGMTGVRWCFFFIGNEEDLAEKIRNLPA